MWSDSIVIKALDLLLKRLHVHLLANPLSVNNRRQVIHTHVPLSSNSINLYQSAEVYIADSFGDRVWVNPWDCHAFVENVWIFGTRLLLISMLASEMTVKPESEYAGWHVLVV